MKVIHRYGKHTGRNIPVNPECFSKDFIKLTNLDRTCVLIGLQLCFHSAMNAV